MQQELEPYLSTGRLSLELRDVDENLAWRQEYGPRVPLLMSPTGEVIAEYHLDTCRLEQWLVSNTAD